MTPDEKNSLALSAYHDGELSWFARFRVEQRLRKSPELRRELAELEELGTLVREVESTPLADSSSAHASTARVSPDFWSEIGPALSRIDREVASTRRSGSSSDSRGWSWESLAATGAVAALMLAVFVVVDPVVDPVIMEDAVAGHSLQGAGRETSGGSLRYLQTNGVSYVVSQDSDDVTIIWLMDSDEITEGA